MSFSSGKYRTNNAKTKQHKNIYACAKDRVTQTTDSNVGKGATVRMNIDKEGASVVKTFEINAQRFETVCFSIPNAFRIRA